MNTPKDYVDETSHRDRFFSDRNDLDLNKSSYDKYAYQYFGSLFDDRQELLNSYQKTLRAAHIQESSDLYLGRLILLSIFIGVTTLGVTLIMTGTMFLFGFMGIFVSSSIVQIIISLLIPLFLGILTGLGFAALYYIRPSYIASRRASRIDATLPSAVTFMYALDRGGMNIVDVLRVLSSSEEVYGEVSKEFSTVIQDMEYFSRDLMTGLTRAGNRSPSTRFSDFMDDLIATLDSGADTAPFLKDKSEELMKDAERDQKKFIETLSLLGEVYVTGFVAGPLFMIIITVIMSMLGGASATQLDGIVYGLLPFMNVGYFFLISTLSGTEPGIKEKIPYKYQTNRKADIDVVGYADDAQDERIKRVAKKKKKRQRTAILRQPVKELMNDPDKTLVFTVPIVLIYLFFSFASGTINLSVEAFIDQPVLQTLYSVLIPVFILSIPISIIYEISNRREKRIIKRLPNALKTLASSNKVGMTLTESLENTADNTSGRLGDELNRVKNDIRWNNNVNSALINFANRMRTPMLNRTVKIITEANSSSENIEEVIKIAAEDVETRVRLDRERSSSMMIYTAIIVISFIVYLFVVNLLDVMFLSTIEGIGPTEFGDDSGGSSFELSDLPVDKFRLVFYHSTIVQAFGSGMIAGYLTSEDIRSGLKFAIVLSVISSVVFIAL